MVSCDTHIRDEPSELVEQAQMSVARLPGVSPSLASALGRLGLECVQDLWFHLPLRYEDRTRITNLADVRAGDQVQVVATVSSVQSSFRYRPQLKVTIRDVAGYSMLLRFFHFGRAQTRLFCPGTRLLCFGEVRGGTHGLEMVHPQYRRLSASEPVVVSECLDPVYPSTEGLSQMRLGRVIAKALTLLPDEEQLELIPASLRSAHRLGSLRQALLYVHHPPVDAALTPLLEGQHPAQKRLAFEELLVHHMSLRQLRAAIRERQAPLLRGDGVLRSAMLAALPFQLTAAQQRVIQEVLKDLAQSKPMLRLVQGDVGSGKTVVAAVAALAAIETDWQVALTAPTELLAEQHLRTFGHWFEPLGIELAWLSSKVTGKARQRVLAHIAEGKAKVAIGTHALMQESVEFAKLGLVIVDEQHRFGVQQRLSLRNKGIDARHDRVAHQLVLTATPIPRTLAMSSYADLDVSSIDELPPGRTPVQTLAISSTRRAEVIERIHAVCAEGRQVYWVCTLIEESEQLRAQAAEVIYTELCASLTGCQVGLLHGRMKAKEKQAIMAAFKTGELSVLVATTVIEVGVDVPNASLMVIENSERLGLAQLHQLRGRVGRGVIASICVLLYQAPLGQLARQRIQVMRQISDGFRIAEKDLELRGPGEVLGTRQTGQLNFRIAELARDAHLLPLVQQIGQHMLSSHAPEAERLVRRWLGAVTCYAQA